jgi:hypothetical protein
MGKGWVPIHARNGKQGYSFIFDRRIKLGHYSQAVR